MSAEVTVEQLGKSFRQWGSEWRYILSWFLPSIKPLEENWVLKDINFSIRHGEAIGIIGQNGAGKSTMLKILTGTTQATKGKIHVSGRVAAILELGMGFNNDMTARQNAIHSLSLMGHSMAEIDAVLPEIENFAEIGEYFDQPMRTYSTGMQARVAFSVATAFKPDLLIVDEVLSVGDSYFQHKSFDKIRQFKDAGTSIIIVTHSMADVRSICDRVIYLDKGIVAKEGLPDEVIDYYNAMIAQKENEKVNFSQIRDDTGWVRTKSGNGKVQLIQLQLLDDETNLHLELVKTNQQIKIKMIIKIMEDLDDLTIGFMLRDKNGNVIWGSNSWHTSQNIENLKANSYYLVSLKFKCILGPGSYSITTALTSSKDHLKDNYGWFDNILVFDVVNTKFPYFIGSTYLDTTFSSKGIEYE